LVRIRQADPTRAFIWTGGMDEELRKAALNYRRAPVAGKIAISPTKG
jgi:hypothetical protein